MLLKVMRLHEEAKRFGNKGGVVDVGCDSGDRRGQVTARRDTGVGSRRRQQELLPPSRPIPSSREGYVNRNDYSGYDNDETK